MASQYWGLNRGATEFAVVTDSSTTSKDVEVRVDLTKYLEKGEIVKMLEEISNAILKGNWPPA